MSVIECPAIQNAMNINTSTLLGHLTRDLVVRVLPSGTSVANFTLGCNRSFKTDDGKTREEVAFVPCSVYGPAASRLEHTKKGSLVLAIGRLRTESWEQNNARCERLVLICDAVQVVHGPKLDPTPPTDGLSGKTEQVGVPF